MACNAQKNENSSNQNHLANETSPYLQQHVNNPVDWYPWGEVALEKAVKEDKLILVSIGYSACHWCHVMEHESFEDTAVAAIMNQHFVNIKVDREERPDVDDVYMTACHLSTGNSCGWPLNAIALPNGKPVWAGTYFPKKQWVEVLNNFIKIKEKELDKLTTYADRLQEGIQQAEAIIPAVAGAEWKLNTADLVNIGENFSNLMDWKNGGTQGAPKFPMPNNYLMLLQLYDINKDERTKEAILLTLDKIANGGIYDQIGGGFARYATDAIWKVPHFEKMLYDNAQLVSLYSRAYQFSKSDRYRQVVYETIEFIERELFDKKVGAFYSSLDADSEGEEGKFYVWQNEEIEQFVSKEHIDLVKDYFGIKKNGNWEEGKNILLVNNSYTDLSKKYDKSLDEVESIVQTAKSTLLQERKNRIRPGLDDKILTSLNGLMIKGLTDAYMAFGDQNFLDLAISNMEFVEAELSQSKVQLWRTYKDGKAHINAFLDDYAHIIQAYLGLYNVTFDSKYLSKAKALTDYAIDHFFHEESGAFFYTSDEDPPLIVRKKVMTDNVIPSSNSTMIKNLQLLHTYLEIPNFKSIADGLLNTMSQDVTKSSQPNFYSNWIMGLLSASTPPYEIAIVGKDFEEKRMALAKEFLPNAIFIGGEEEGDLALLQDKKVEGETRIYVCQNKVCKIPVTEVDKALELLKQ